MTQSTPRRLLLVEDEAIIALDQGYCIRSFGYDVDVARDAGVAIEKVETAFAAGTPYHLILMDIDLGADMDGTEAAKIILKRHTLPIVFLTSHGEREMVEKVRSITRYGYVLKQSGEFVLRSSIEMAFDLFEAHERETRDRIGLDNAFFRQLLDSAPEPIVVADMEAGIVHINAEFTRLFGYTEQEVRGGNIRKIIVPPEYIAEAEALKRAVNAGHQVTVDTVRCDRDRRPIEVQVIAKPVFFKGGQVAVFGIYRDITERRRMEQEERKRLKEQKLLLKEVHHRIRNNLMTVMSLLTLRTSTLSDSAAIAALEESRGRIETMLLIYDSLYQSGEYRDVDLDAYLAKLLDRVSDNHVHHDRVRLEHQLEPVRLPSSIAVPIGLIAYELLTNCFKHAFPDGGEGTITVELRSTNHGLTLGISDNGVSMPTPNHFDRPDQAGMDGFGLTMVANLAEQINATLTVKTGNGTSFHLTMDDRQPQAAHPQSGEL